ncbi:COMM domain-containing protein 2-like [Lineus longissimus]|uniref:COMM domain-containing protein 2-like n=1 Tax=Lineus longissimus TaxID=88925 RepID=UPI002B4C9DDD
MLLVLDDVHKQHLQYITEVSVDVLAEFCRMSVEFIKKGANPKVYQGAAQKLGVEVHIVQHGIQGLMHLLEESSRLLLNDIDFQDSIMTIGFSEELKEVLFQSYLESRHDIRKILCEMSMDLPHYKNLEWRLDIQVASRSLRHQTNPIILLKLLTQDGDTEESTVLQTDPVNLIHMTNVLENALQELKSAHCRRIVRNIK